jgi:hypothetical protein
MTPQLSTHLDANLFRRDWGKRVGVIEETFLLRWVPPQAEEGY